ncbi:MAG: D-alanyl-D-alanine carboxypeptidase, partial [Comamonas sp.]
ITTQIVRTDPLMAPIAKGQQVGTLKVMVAEQVAAELPIFALENVSEGGFFRRMWDAIRLWIR